MTGEEQLLDLRRQWCDLHGHDWSRWIRRNGQHARSCGFCGDVQFMIRGSKP